LWSRSTSVVEGDEVGRVRRVCLVAAALALLAVTLAGCGGGGKTAVHQSTAPTVTIPLKTVSLGKVAYERTMARLGNQLVGSVKGLFPLTEAQPGTDVSKATLEKLAKTRAVVTTVMARVAAIAPPAPIRSEHQRLLQGIAALGGELDKLIEVEENGTSEAFGIYARFNSVRTIAKATTAMEKKGYKIG
jgi:hypothetical protein